MEVINTKPEEKTIKEEVKDPNTKETVEEEEETNLQVDQSSESNYDPFQEYSAI